MDWRMNRIWLRRMIARFAIATSRVVWPEPSIHAQLRGNKNDLGAEWSRRFGTVTDLSWLHAIVADIIMLVYKNKHQNYSRVVDDRKHFI